MQKEIKIQIPEGYEIDTEKSTFTKIIFKKSLSWPKNWEDLKVVEGFYISSNSSILTTRSVPTDTSKNTIPTESLTTAMLALSQLLQLRNYIWKNFCNNYTFKRGTDAYCISTQYDELKVYDISNSNRILTFPSKEIAIEFFEKYKDLIKIAKELL